MHLELADLALATRADGSTCALASRDAALLTWLALEGPTPRARLAELLWPDSEPIAARNNLRQRLFKLQKQCGELVSGTRTLWLAPGVAHDLQGSPGVLGALRFPDAPELDAWVRDQRDQRSGAVRQDIERQADALEHVGDLAAALPVAQALLRLEPLSEAAHRRVMRLHYLKGDRAGALLAFDHCERTLKDEVGATPSGETLALLRTVEAAQAHPWLPGQPLPASALRPPQLIGRESELSALVRAWGTGQLFVLTGQAGAGKSRVLDAIGEATEGVLLVCARPGDDKVPLATLSRLVQRLAERWPMLRAAPPYAASTAYLAGPPGREPPSARSVAPMVVDLLQAARTLPDHGLRSLVLDDLQFADEATVDIWQELLVWPALAGLRVGLAARVEGPAAGARKAALSEGSDAVIVPLPALTVDAVRPFIESLALPLVDAGAVAAALVRRVGGNPLHLLETIRHALEKHGQLRADNLEAPARVTELLEQRLLALPADGLLVVRIAAVAGDEFDPDLAAAVSRRDVLELADAWHALERLGLIDTRGFMHDLIGEAAQRLLPQPIARVLHARVAAHLAQRGASAARLAHHLLCAGNEAAAVPHLAAAARLAWHLGRSREAGVAYLRAADIELSRGRPDAAFDLLFERAKVIEELGPRPALLPAIECLSPITRTASQQARLAYMRTIRFHHDADHAGCEARIDDSLALAMGSSDREIEAECRYTKAFYLAHAGRLHDAVEQLTTAAALHRGLSNEHRAMMIEGSVHTVLLWMGQARRALDLQRQALQQAADAGSSSLLAAVLMRQADSELHLGDVRAALQLAGRALAAMRATDMIGGELARTTWYIADVLRRCGQWGEALAVVTETHQRIAAQSDPEQLLAAALAGIYLDLGRPDLAHRHIEAFAAASQHSVRQRLRALALRGKWGFAVGTDDGTTRVAGDTPGSENLLQACELALAVGQAGAPDLTASQCTTLVARCEPQGLREELVPLHALNARLHARAGDPQRAGASVASAEEALRIGEIGAITPLCCLWLAQTLQMLGRSADALLHARQGTAWLMGRAQQSVPPEFRDSFLHRHRVHRELLLLARP